MKKKDHKMLAEYWVRRMDHQIPLLKRMAFIFGNFEPDINYLTYLHGFTHYRNFLGHHFDHVFPVLLHLIDRYENSFFSITAYYRLGKCFHYTADIFTYPHNPCFTGSMKEHVSYEMKLHACIHKALCAEGDERFSSNFTAVQNIRESLTKMHERYLGEEHSCELDLWYILNATQLLAEAYLFTEEEREGRIHLEEPLLLPPEEPVYFKPALEINRPRSRSL